MDNNEKALGFLKLLRKNGGLINLVAIDPDTKRIEGITREIDHADIKDFIVKHSGHSNLYYTPNLPRSGSPDGKLTKEDIKAPLFVYLDADPKKEAELKAERLRLRDFAETLNRSPNPPTYIIDSGNGIQALWEFAELNDSLELPAEPGTEVEPLWAEEFGRGLAHTFGTDPVQNVDRLLRLPYTLNIPDAKKRALGRKPALATVTHAAKRSYTKQQLLTIAQPIPAPEYDKLDALDIDTSLLTDALTWYDVPDVKSRFTSTMIADPHLQRLLLKATDLPSRSEYDMAVASILKSHGWNTQDIATALWLSPLGKGKDTTFRELSRTIARAASPTASLALDPDTVSTIASQPNPNLPPVAQGIPLEGFAALSIDPPRRLRLNHNLDWRSTFKPLIKGLINAQSMVVMYGQSNVGKSFMSLELAAHVALGRDWNGYKIKEQCAVIYVCAEAGQSFGLREQAVRRRLGVDREASVSDWPFFTITDHVNFLQDPSTQADDVGDVIKLAKWIKGTHGLDVGMVVVDTLSTSFQGGNENSSDDMGKYIGHMKQIQGDAGVCVMIVHHSGKDQAAGARGHSSLRAATDTELEVKAEKVGGRYRREMLSRKQRDTESDVAIEFGLNVVEMAKDEDGDPISTCTVVLPSDTEFESVIPNPLLSFGSERDPQMYYAVAMGEMMNMNKTNQVNILFNKIMDDPIDILEVGTDLEKIRQIMTNRLNQGGKGFLKIEASNKGGDQVTRNSRKRLVKGGLIYENDKNQWFVR